PRAASFFFFSSRRRHTRFSRDWSSDVCSSDLPTAEAVAAAITDKTKAVYSETVGNPDLKTLDIRAVADVAHAAGVPLIIDNTIQIGRASCRERVYVSAETRPRRKKNAWQARHL